MHFDILTIFPQLFEAFRTVGVLGKAVERGVVGLEVHDLRDWADNKWRQLDDEPYGGGAGMVLQAPPVLAAVRQLQQGDSAPPRSLVLGPRGRVFDQAMARELADENRIVLLCGRYEGFDERIFDHSRLEEVSIGDYVLGGGEVAAMVVVEAVGRLVEGVVGDPDSVIDDSFSCGLLDHPCFTRPAEVEGKSVPEVLLSGDHERIRRWRLQQAVELTATRRPDLIKKSWARYSDEIRELVRTVAPELADNAAEESTCRSS